MRGSIEGLDVDTSHFRGNHPPEFSLEGLDAGHGGALPRDARWTPICESTSIEEDAHNYVPISDRRAWTHIRLNIFPDGGVARLRVYGRVLPVFPEAQQELELSAIRNGGLVSECSDQHFCHMGNLILPDKPRHMGDGWETRRRRGAGHDWVILSLGAPGRVDRIELDTGFYKGNYPDRCSIEGSSGDGQWHTMIEETKLLPDHVHVYSNPILPGPFGLIRLNIFPDGGVARLRIFGTVDANARHD